MRLLDGLLDYREERGMSEDVQNLPLRTLERKIEAYQKEAKETLVEITNKQAYLDRRREDYRKIQEKIKAYQLALRVLIHGSLPISAIIEPKLGEKDE